MTRPIDSFITRWKDSGAAERANYQLFGGTGCIDLYKRGCFVLKAQQGNDQPDHPPPG